MIKKAIILLAVLLVAGCGTKILPLSKKGEPFVQVQEDGLYFKSAKVTDYSSEYIGHGDTRYSLRLYNGTQIVYSTSTRGVACVSYDHNVSFKDIDFTDPDCSGSVQIIRSKLDQK